jgi:hypothetical protein
MADAYFTAARLRELEHQLSTRDLDVLRVVSDLRFMRGDQLARYCFAADPVSPRTIRHALLRLVELGLLERLPRPVGGIRSGSAGFVYHLSLGGQRLAMHRGWQAPRRRRRPVVPGQLFVAHALQVAELHTRLIEAERSGRFELIELIAEPSCWRNFDGLGHQRRVLKPDSLLRLGLDAYEDSYFIEVDRGTEGSLALDRQLELYSVYAASGQEQAKHAVFPKVLWTTNTPQRAAIIQSCIRHLDPIQQALFAVVTFNAALDFICGPAADPFAADIP